DRAARALEAVLIALLQAALATTTTATEAFALVFGVTRRDARGRALTLEGRTLGFLAVTTLVVLATLDAARLFLLALFARRGGRGGSGRLGSHRGRRDHRRAGLLFNLQARLASRFLFRLTAGVFGLLARGSLIGG